MLFIQKRKYKKFKGRTVINFSHPDHEMTGVNPEGVIVGYGENQLIVRCVNCIGWPLDTMKLIHRIDKDQLDSSAGYWFIDKYELREGLVEEIKLEETNDTSE